jgi:hypothetical protein
MVVAQQSNAGAVRSELSQSMTCFRVLVHRAGALDHCRDIAVLSVKREKNSNAAFLIGGRKGDRNIIRLRRFPVVPT